VRAASSPSWINRKLSGRIPELDGVRGLAILLVLILHLAVMTVTPTAEWQMKSMVLFRLYCNGVDLFFVLSGFLIGGILLDSKGAAGYYRTFYLRRLHRIAPVYAVLIATFAIGGYFIGGEMFNHRVPFWSYPLFIQNIFMTLHGYGSGWMSATWSLAVEEQFYLVLPFAVQRLSRKGIVGFAIGMIVIAPVLRVLIAREGFNGCNLLPCRSDALGFGLLVAVACRNRTVWTWLVSYRRCVCWAFALLGLLGLDGILGGFVLGYGWTAVGYTWIAAFNTALLILAIVTPGRIVGPMFRNFALSWLGTVSYFVYLFHGGIQLLYHHVFFGQMPSVHNLPTLYVTVLSLVTVLVLAGISWRVLEKPLLKRAAMRYRYGRI